MLDAYESREGSFEIVDSQMIEARSSRLLYYRLLRFLIVVLVLVSIILVVLAFVSNWVWIFLLIFSVSFGVMAFQNMQRLYEMLSPQIASILLEYDQHKHLNSFKLRRWLQSEIDTFTEEDIRYNQAEGFKVKWYNDGFLEVHIIVDPNFPGTKIFETYDFLTIGELIVFFQTAVPQLDEWYFELEDGSQWSEENLQELENEKQSARVPWNVREFFSNL